MHVLSPMLSNDLALICRSLQGKAAFINVEDSTSVFINEEFFGID